MTWKEAYASLKSLYKNMMFPKIEFLPNGQIIHKREWTMTEVDQLDVHFFGDLLSEDEPEKVGFIDQIW